MTIKFVSVNESMKTLYRPTLKDVPKLAQMMVDAFIDYPLHAWILPDENDRREKLLIHFKMIVRYGLKYGDTYSTSADCNDIAIFIHPDSGPMSTWRWIKCGGIQFIRAYGKTAMKRFELAAVAAPEKIRRKNAPENHSYLLYLAVDPRLHGQGWTKILLGPMFDQFDKQKVPCYVETFKQRNEAIYNKLGFDTIDKFPVPDTGLTLISLLRNPC